MTAEGTERTQGIGVMRVGTDVVPELVERITAFYNAGFPNSPHEARYKRHMYRSPAASPVILIAEEEGQIAGLLESWIVNKTERRRLLTTLLVAEHLRRRGLATRLVRDFLAILAEKTDNCPLVVNYRASKKEMLEPLYARFGFEFPRVAGNYANAEEMWEMRR